LWRLEDRKRNFVREGYGKPVLSKQKKQVVQKTSLLRRGENSDGLKGGGHFRWAERRK